MIKRIIFVSAVVMLLTGFGGEYFIRTSGEAARNSRSRLCTGLNIIIHDSLENNLISKRDVAAIVKKCSRTVGQVLDSINTDSIEKSLGERGEIMTAEVYTTRNGLLNIEVTQRTAVLRLECPGKAFYCDNEGYLFPVRCCADVPVATGQVVISEERGYRGYSSDYKEKEWLKGMISLARYIEGHDYWHRQVEQIFVEWNGDVMLYMHEGDQRFNIGTTDNLDEKFGKIETFYKNILPTEKGRNYTRVNLKYRNQIVCM